MVETLVSMAVLMIFFASVVLIFQIVTEIVGESRARVVATALASEKIEVVRNLAYNDLGTVGGIPAGPLAQIEQVVSGGQTFQVATSIVYIDDPFDGLAPTDLVNTDYKRIRIAVSWQGAFPSRKPVVLITDVAPNGIETIEGGGTLFVNVINNSGEPVSGANVVIQNDSVIPNIDLQAVSDSNGRVLLPGAPICNECYEINVSKTGFSSDRTYSIGEVANPLKPHPGVIEGEVTSITLSIDQAATLQVLTTGPQQNNYPPFAGIQFKLKGGKTIGTDTGDKPVYKYDRFHFSGPGGLLTITGLEADTYEISIPEPSTVDFAGSSPISPFPLLPGSTRNVIIVTNPASSNNLLVVVQNVAGQPVSTASAELSNYLGQVATRSAGPLGKGNNGQAFFSGISGGAYSLRVTQDGYKEATSSAVVSGDSINYIILEPEN